jgi:hypothetical protein
MLRSGHRRLIRYPYAEGYRAALLRARADLKLIEEDLRLEHAMQREEIEGLRAQIAELRQLAGLRDPAQPLQ